MQMKEVLKCNDVNLYDEGSMPCFSNQGQGLQTNPGVLFSNLWTFLAMGISVDLKADI